MNFDEVFKYLRMIYRWRYLFLFISLAVMTAIVATAYTLPKKYKADSTVFIETNVINDLVKGIAVTPDMEGRIKVLKYALLSRDIISKVLSDLDRDVLAENKGELQEMIKDLQERTNISVKEKERFFNVSIVDQDPAFAQAYINKLVSTYVEENISGKREETYGANRFLDEQIVHFKGKLNEAEDAIIRFRRENGVLLSVDEQAILSDLQQYQREIDAVSLDLETQRAIIQSLQQQKEEIDPTVAIYSESQKEDRLLQIQQRIRQLLMTYTDNYPEVIRLQMEGKALQENLGEEAEEESVSLSSEMTTVNPVFQDVQQRIMGAQTEISALERKKRFLNDILHKKEQELQEVPENKKKLGALMQERDSVRKIYEELLLRMGQSEVSKQMEIGDKTTTFRIIDPAVFPQNPVSPDMIQMILLAIAAGIGCGAGLVILLENTRSTVKATSQIESLGIEVLTVIPRMVDPLQARKILRRDLLAYSIGFVYFGGVVGLLGYEFLKRLN